MNKKIERFEDLLIWQRSMDLVCEVYRNFGKINDFGFRDQIQRASVSIPANISEGFERDTNKEFVRYLFIARGSCGECRTLLLLAQRLGIIKESLAKVLIKESVELSSMIYGLIKIRKEKFK
ncbi:MAG: four helix bundle protein [Bacteroidota bacterium]